MWNSVKIFIVFKTYSIFFLDFSYLREFNHTIRIILFYEIKMWNFKIRQEIFCWILRFFCSCLSRPFKRLRKTLRGVYRNLCWVNLLGFYPLMIFRNPLWLWGATGDKLFRYRSDFVFICLLRVIILNFLLFFFKIWKFIFWCQSGLFLCKT